MGKTTGLTRTAAAVVLGALTAGLWPAEAAAQEVANRRDACNPWEHVPASEALGTPATALLFCTDAQDRQVLALRIDCQTAPVRMVVRYRPLFAFDPPVIKEPDPEPLPEGVTQAEADAKRLFDAIPYEDSGVVIRDGGVGPGQEMVFMDFQSFGYTGVADWDAPEWVFVEKEPLSPMFSRLITGNFADIKLLAYGITERFPLRGSGKALRPVVETCRIAKRDADRASQ
ncbi:MAG: hypothetical protein AAF761_00830 [Pseudomonadota bacterium]